MRRVRGMLEIRPEQRARMREHAIERYVARTLEQFRRCFPRHCEINGDEPMRGMIRLGVDRAGAHEIVGERHVILYTSLMLLFGSFFDEDPQCDWAGRILGDRMLVRESVRAKRLYETGVGFWERVAGPQNVKLVRAIRRLRAVDAYGLSREEFVEEFKEAFASKQTLVHAIWKQAERIAQTHGLESPQDIAVVAGLVSLLGAGFDKDPMFPWSASALAGDRDLREAAMQHADRWLAHAEGVA